MPVAILQKLAAMNSKVQSAMNRWCLALTIVLAPALSNHLLSQDTSTANQPGPIAANPSNGGSVPSGLSPMAGGGAMADFSTIMMLIEQTIEPDSWLNAGGESTQFPYPNGVYVDPRGHIRRLKESGNLSNSFALGGTNRSFAGKGMRSVSLRQLDAAIAQRLSMGLSPTRDMHEMGGLARIQYVVMDKAHDDVLFVGPIAQGTEGICGFTLDDLVTLARVVSNKTNPLGCSIDPTQEGLKKAGELLNQSSTVQRLARQPRAVTEQLRTALGAHSINVFGLDSSSSTAVALIDADEHMKRVGLGAARTTPHVRSYFENLDSDTSLPQQSLIRWWFSYSDQPLSVNEQGDVIEFPANTVAVLSQQQWMDQQGTRKPTHQADRAADAFAAEMTNKLPQIRKVHPTYARLNAIFELSLALQLAVDASQQDNLASWLPTVCQDNRLVTPVAQPPKTIDGLATFNRMRNGTVVAVISGGIVVDVAATAGQQKRVNSKSSLVASTSKIKQSENVIITWHD